MFAKRKSCSAWWSRNADFWTDPTSVRTRASQQGARCNGYDPGSEADGILLPEDLFELTVAAVAKDVKVVEAAKAMQSTFWSLVPPHGKNNRSVQTHLHDPLFTRPDRSPSLAKTARNVHTMLSPEESQSSQSTVVEFEPRGDAPPDWLAVGVANCEERKICSTDQRYVFNDIIGFIECNRKMRQALSILD